MSLNLLTYRYQCHAYHFIPLTVYSILITEQYIYYFHSQEVSKEYTSAFNPVFLKKIMHDLIQENSLKTFTLTNYVYQFVYLYRNFFSSSQHGRTISYVYLTISYLYSTEVFYFPPFMFLMVVLLTCYIIMYLQIYLRQSILK